jgi:hypothetical protein
MLSNTKDFFGLFQNGSTRQICLSILQHQDLRDNPNRRSDFAVNVPIPKDILDGKIEGQAAIQYRVVELPLPYPETKDSLGMPIEVEAPRV